MRTFAIAGIVLLLLLPSSGHADLDVNVPPGSPIEWVKQLPSLIFTRDSSTTKRSDGDVTSVDPLKGGGTDVNAASGASVFAYTLITTPDITGHLSWVNKKLPLKDDDIETRGKKDIETGGIGASGKVEWPYPPEIGNALHWMGLAVYLRKMLHPNLISEAESAEYLIEMGYPALSATYAVGKQASVARMVEAVELAVQPIPASPPKPKNGKTVFETMINQFVAMELTSHYPTDPSRNFCRHLNVIEELCLDAVMEATKSSHTFLQQNAVYALGNYRADVIVPIRLAFLKTKDAVVRNRALSALVRRDDSDPEVIKRLIKDLSGDDKYFRSYAAYALGTIGDQSAVDALVKELKEKRNRDEPDFLWAAIPALGRLKNNAREVIDILKTIKAELEANPTKFDEQPQGSMKPDRPDAAGVKGQILLHMTLLALAANGDQESIEAILKLAEEGKKPDAGDPPGGNRNQRRGGAAQQNIESDILKKFKPACYYIVMDVLAALGEKGRALLREIVTKDSDVMIRSYALYQYCMPTPDMELIKSMDDKYPAALRALGAVLAIGHDDKLAEQLAQGVVEAYIKEPKAVGADYAVISAIQTLGKLAVLKADKVTEVADTALKNLPPPPAAAPAPPAPGQPGQPGGPQPPPAGRGQGGPGVITVNMPVLENALIELGYLKDKTSVAKLVEILKGSSHRGRGEAALALGYLGGKEAIDALIPALQDKDGWVRMCAFLALRRISGNIGKDYEHNWLFGSESDLKKGVRKWKEWHEGK